MQHLQSAPIQNPLNFYNQSWPVLNRFLPNIRSQQLLKMTYYNYHLIMSNPANNTSLARILRYLLQSTPSYLVTNMAIINHKGNAQARVNSNSFPVPLVSQDKVFTVTALVTRQMRPKKRLNSVLRKMIMWESRSFLIHRLSVLDSSNWTYASLSMQR